jgi:NADPH:quinone reductase-like Zn-dependent oxidoreductase
MNKIWIRKFGKSEILSIEENNNQTNNIGPKEVKVDVYFSGINFADIIMRLGFYKDAPKKPFVPGYEFSGVIKETGSEVKNLKVGDKVYAGSLFGGYSSEIIIPSWMAVKLPDSMCLKEGAAIPVAFITSYAAIFDMARVRRGDSVLIDCATGGVGIIMLQMLNAIGANTVGLTSSIHKKDLIQSYGAKAHTHEEFWSNKDIKNFDFILNSQGGSSIRKHYNRLAYTGRIICLGISSGIKSGKRDYIAIAKAALTMPKFNIISMFDKNRGVYALNALKLMENTNYAKDNIKNFQKIEDLKLKPYIGKVFNYKEVSNAHRYIEERKGSGKILLSWKE